MNAPDAPALANATIQKIRPMTAMARLTAPRMMPVIHRPLDACGSFFLPSTPRMIAAAGMNRPRIDPTIGMTTIQAPRKPTIPAMSEMMLRTGALAGAAPPA